MESFKRIEMEKKYIAIVDDEIDVLNMLKRFLEKNDGYHIDVFSKPQEALDNLKIRNYDLVLLDIMMPKISGLDILKEIKEHKNGIKVIMMTAHSTLNTSLKSDTYGADAYIEKPFHSLLNLKETVKQLLSEG